MQQLRYLIVMAAQLFLAAAPAGAQQTSGQGAPLRFQTGELPGDTSFLITDRTSGWYTRFAASPDAEAALLKPHPAAPETASPPAVFLAGRWVPLVWSSGRYFLYRPCDNVYDREIRIRNGIYREWTGTEWADGQIVSPDSAGNSRYVLTASNDTISMRTIDPLRGLAIFVARGQDGYVDRQLMADSREAHRFPIIVNQCISKKRREIGFATPDYPALLQGRAQVVAGP